MEELATLLDDLRREGVELWVEGERLKVRAPGGISERRRSELRAMRERLVAHLCGQAPFEPAEQHRFPLSYAQRALLYLDRFEGTGSAYHLSIGARLHGRLDQLALCAALRDIETKHEILRTRYAWDVGAPTQEVLPPGGLDLAVVNATDWMPSRVADYVRSETERTFDLAAVPPIRCRLLCISATEHVLLIVAHHIATDGPSLGLLFEELELRYEIRAAGAAAEPPPDALSHSDYAAWQQRCAESGAFDRDLAYWTERLNSAPDLLDLPSDRRVSRETGNAGGAVEFQWPRDLGARVLASARARGMTPFMVLLGAFQLLLARWTGQSDICVGIPFAVRPAAFEGRIGNFLNTLVLRATVDPRDRADAFLDQVRDTALEAFAHATAPFELVVARMRKPREPGVNPLFQCLFSLDDVAHIPLRLGDLETERIWPELGTAKFPLSLFASIEDGVVRGTFEYSTALFEPETVEALAACLPVLTEALLAGDGRLLGTLPLLPGPLWDRIVRERNRTDLPLAEARTLDALFAARLPGHREATALIGDAEAVTYAELDRAADAVAAFLSDAGVGPESIVGLCLERKPMLVAAMLGILRAGGAYLPLDPAYPPDRLDFMIDDSRCRVIVTNNGWRSRLEADGRVVIGLPETMAALPPASSDRRASPRPDNLAYLIYTSGSTGEPKGVALTHANMTAFLGWAETAFGDEARQGILATTSVCFDLSIFELFLPLVTGGSVILLDSAATLVEQEPDVRAILLNTVPSAAAVLCETGRLPPGLSTLNLAGEALKRHLVEQIHEMAPGIRLCNLYGPSEYTTYSTWCEVPSEPGAPVDIGRPIANTRVYILDPWGQPVLDGAPGEIFIGGAGLARGYAGRPGLTAERFRPDPFGPPGARIYATGDFGRYHRDGRIHYLGRQDQQVKIRGYRIELGEIEARLRDCDGVRESAVVVRQSTQGPELVAHVALSDAAGEANAEGLRTALARNLPGHMIPAKWRFHEALPLNPNGKIDRKVLAETDADSGLARASYAAPRDAAESFLAETWRDVLRVDRVGIDDNFFELGGHSLLATAIVARLADERFPQVALRDIFLAPTVRALAARLASVSDVRAERIPIAERSGPLPTSFAQQRMWFLDQLEPQRALYNLCIAWRMTGPLDVDVLRRCLCEIRSRHEILRTRFVAGDDAIPMQVVDDDGDVPLPLIDLSAAEHPEAEAERWLRDDAAILFDLSAGPLFRAGIVRLGEQAHILQIGMPHIVADGWSLDVILSEIGILYPAFQRGAGSPLDPLPIQYSDYAAWEHERLAGPDLERHLSYFRALLDDAPKLLDLPTDRERPAVATYGGDVHEFTFDAALSEQLRQAARRQQVSLFMLMSAIFDVLLHRYSGQRDFCIGYSVGNRSRLQTEGLVGVFVNTLVRRVRIDDSKRFDAHLAEVCRQMLDADVHQEFPFEKLVEELNPTRALGHHPIFQVTYSYSTTHGPRTRKTRTLRGVGEQEVSLPGIDLGLVEPGYESAKFDLAVFISETGEELEGDIEFATDLFDRETIRSLSRQFEALCRSAVADLGATIGALDLLPEQDRDLVLDNPERNDRDPIEDLLLSFASQVAGQPDAVAVEAGGDRQSYAQIAASADALASQIRALAIGREDRVGLLLPPGPDLAASILGAIAARAAFEILEAESDLAGLAAIVTGAPIAAPAGLPLILFGRASGGGSGNDLACQPADPGDLACRLATAGTADDRQLVMISRQCLAENVSLLRDQFSATAAVRIGIAAPAGHDLAVTTLLLALTSGGCAAFLTGETPMLAGVEMLIATPASLRALPVGALQLPQLKAVGLSRQLPDDALLRALRQAAPQAQIVDFYGAAGCATVAAVSDAAGGDGSAKPWQRVAGARTYVLDGRLRPLPIGVPGRLFVAGEGLARGYVSPRATAEHFLPDPFGPPGARMLATHDLGRILPDGRIELRGRADGGSGLGQAELSLERIETALCQLPNVADAAACLAKTGGGAQLVAFAVLAPGSASTSAQVRSGLDSGLPRNLVPKHVRIVPALPRLPSGELDRSALAAMAAEAARAGTTKRPPHTSTERALAAIWAELLQRECTDTSESFFGLGGHSLTAMRLIMRIWQRMNIRIPLRAVFESPVLSDLAAQIDAARMIESDSGKDQASAPIPALPRPRAWAAVPAEAQAS